MLSNETNVRVVNKFRGYYLEDCACQFCAFYKGKKRGCSLEKCCCSEEKQDAEAHRRINRKWGSTLWER